MCALSHFSFTHIHTKYKTLFDLQFYLTNEGSGNDEDERDHPVQKYSFYKKSKKPREVNCPLSFSKETSIRMYHLINCKNKIIIVVSSSNWWKEVPSTSFNMASTLSWDTEIYCFFHSLLIHLSFPISDKRTDRLHQSCRAENYNRIWYFWTLYCGSDIVPITFHWPSNSQGNPGR